MLLFPDNFFCDGINSISKFLGLCPEKVIYLHSVSDDPVGKRRFIQPLGYMPRAGNSQKNSKAIFFNIPDCVIYDFEKMGLLKKNDVISVDVNCIEKLNENKLNNKLESNLLDYYIVSYDYKKLPYFKPIVSKIEGFDNFHKRYISNAGDDFFLPRIIIDKSDKISTEKVKNFVCDKIDEGYNEGFYLKKDMSSGGAGVEPLIGEKNHIIDKTVSQVKTEGGTWILECTAPSHYSNVGLSAIVSDKKICIAGIAEQITIDGTRYIGCNVYPETGKFFDSAIKAANGLLLTLMEDGFRGPIGLDILIPDENENKCAKIIDLNPRFTASVPLLSVVHFCLARGAKREEIFSQSRLMKFRKSDTYEKIVKEFVKEDQFCISKKSGIIVFPPSSSEPPVAEVICIDKCKDLPIWKRFKKEWKQRLNEGK